MGESDHDLLVQILEKVKTLDEKQDTTMLALSGMEHRVAAIELSDARDSEKIRGIRDDVNRLVNLPSIAVLVNRVDALEKRSNNWDILNSTGVAFATILGIFFGSK